MRFTCSRAEVKFVQDEGRRAAYGLSKERTTICFSKPEAPMSTHELFPYLRVARCADAIDFYKRVFGATEKFRLAEPSGRIGHCELLFGETTLMLSDEFLEFGICAPGETDARPSVGIHLHVDDADASIAAAIEAGATLVREPQDHFYGERSGTVRDPFGHEWLIGHSIEEVTTEEMQRRYTEMMS